MIAWLTPGAAAPTRGTLQALDAFEVSPVLVNAEGVSERLDDPVLPPLGPGESIIYSVYGHMPGRGVEALADCDTHVEAVTLKTNLQNFRVSSGPLDAVFAPSASPVRVGAEASPTPARHAGPREAEATERRYVVVRGDTPEEAGVSVMSGRELVEAISMSDTCSVRSVHVVEHGELVRLTVQGTWHDPSDPLAIRVNAPDGRVLESGCGVDH
ncbi:MAG: hypothetical protein H3C62_00830 [Gemmatimonadaceae bacterium]|nr:hypothetical protein [Gemmatimonadaceae bacterium]